jgi:hypothetical protein
MSGGSACHETWLAVAAAYGVVSAAAVVSLRHVWFVRKLPLLILAACLCEPVPWHRLAVFHRLYQQAVALRQKMEVRREDIKKSEIETIQQNKTSMSWISSEMMRDRSAGPFDNYGEMLYAESLESLARKRDKVGGGRLCWGHEMKSIC